MDETLESIDRTQRPRAGQGDRRSSRAVCRLSGRRTRDWRLVARYGTQTIRGYLGALLDYAERMARAEIATWPKGTYRFTDHIDSDGLSDDPVPLTVAVTVRGDGTLNVDWSGTSKQVRAAINSTLSFTKSNTFLSVRCALRGDIPNNAGVFRCIEVSAPEGSVLNPISPAPVAARALTGYRVMDTMFGALAQIVPHIMPAAGEGGNTVVCLGRTPSGQPPIHHRRHDQRLLGRASGPGRHRSDHQPVAKSVEHACRGSGAPASGADRGLRARAGLRRGRVLSRRAWSTPILSVAGR